MSIKNDFGWKIWKFQIFPIGICCKVEFMEHFRIGPYTGKMIFSKKDLTIMLTD